MDSEVINICVPDEIPKHMIEERDAATLREYFEEKDFTDKIRGGMGIPRVDIFQASIFDWVRGMDQSIKDIVFIVGRFNYVAMGLMPYTGPVSVDDYKMYLQLRDVMEKYPEVADALAYLDDLAKAIPKNIKKSAQDQMLQDQR